MGKKSGKGKKVTEEEYNSWDEYESKVEEEIERSDDDHDDDFMGNRVDVQRYFDEEASEGTGSEVDSGSSASSHNDDEDNNDGEAKKMKVLGRERPRKWISSSSNVIKTCRHFSYSLIECAWNFHWESHQVADLITLIVDELQLETDMIINLLIKTNSVDIETIASLIDKGASFSNENILFLLQNGTADAIRFCKSVGEALDHGLLSLRNTSTLEAICKLPAEKNFNFTAVSCLSSLFVEHARSKALYGECFSMITEHMPPQDIAVLGMKVVSSHVFRELKGKLNQFLQKVTVGRAELETQINNKFHRDDAGEIMESDEDSEGNLKDFVVDDDIVYMDTSAEEDNGEEEEEEYEEGDDDDSVPLAGDDGTNVHFYRKVDMVSRKARRDEDGLWNTQPSLPTKKEKKRKNREEKRQAKKLQKLGEKEERKTTKRFDLQSSSSEEERDNEEAKIAKKKTKTKSSPSKKDVVQLDIDTSPDQRALKQKTKAQNQQREIVSLISPPESLTKDKKQATRDVSRRKQITLDSDEEEDEREFQGTNNRGTNNSNKRGISDGNGNMKKRADSTSSSSSSSSDNDEKPVAKKPRKDISALFPSLPASSAAIPTPAIKYSTIGISKKPMEDVIDFSDDHFSPPEHKTHSKKRHASSTAVGGKHGGEKPKTSKHGKPNISSSLKNPHEEHDDSVDDSSSGDERAKSTKNNNKSITDNNKKSSKHQVSASAANDYYDF